MPRYEIRSSRTYPGITVVRTCPAVHIIYKDGKYWDSRSKLANAKKMVALYIERDLKLLGAILCHTSPDCETGSIDTILAALSTAEVKDAYIEKFWAADAIYQI